MFLKSTALFWGTVLVLLSGSQCHPRAKRQLVPWSDIFTPIERDVCITASDQLGNTLHHVIDIEDCKNKCLAAEGNETCKSIDFRHIGGYGDCRLSTSVSKGACSPGVIRLFTAREKLECPDNWILFENVCLQLFANADRRDWSTARAFCAAQAPGKGVDLVQPMDFNKLKTLIESLKTTISDADIAESYWVGGSDLANENVWRWINGVAIPQETLLASWALSQPETGGDNEKCLMEAVGGAVTGLFDKSCSSKYAFICAHPIIPSVGL